MFTPRKSALPVKKSPERGGEVKRDTPVVEKSGHAFRDQEAFVFSFPSPNRSTQVSARQKRKFHAIGKPCAGPLVYSVLVGGGGEEPHLFGKPITA